VGRHDDPHGLLNPGRIAGFDAIADAPGGADNDTGRQSGVGLAR